VIDKLLTGYNSVHSTTGMAPSQVNPSNIYAVWKRLNSLRLEIRQGRVKFGVGDLVRITKEKRFRYYKNIMDQFYVVLPSDSSGSDFPETQ
jgi:hypothetical protein